VTVIVFAVRGVPVPQGSMRCLGAGARGSAGGRHVLVANNDRDLADWRERVELRARVASREQAGGEPLTGPVRLDLLFALPRPTSVTPRDRLWPIVKPDRDKLERAVCDALTRARLWRDDSQAVDGRTVKTYAGNPDALPWPGVLVRIQPLIEQPEPLEGIPS